MVTNDPLREWAQDETRPCFFDTVEEYVHYLRDPRRDFNDDTELWQQLLTASINEDPELHAVFHELRCGGAKLALQEGHLKLLPRFIDPEEDPDHGTLWANESEWKSDCEELLEPYKYTLDQLLTKIEEDHEPPQEELGL